MSYCTAAQIEAMYGRALSDEAIERAAAWQALAESLIDAAVPGHWGGAVTDERIVPDGPAVWLRSAPVLSVQAVRGTWRGTTDTIAIVLTTGYEKDDLVHGRLYVPGWANYAALSIDYTVGDPPECVQQGTAALLAEWLARGPGNAPSTAPSVRLGAFQVQRSATSPADAAALLPARVRALLWPVARPFVFA